MFSSRFFTNEIPERRCAMSHISPPVGVDIMAVFHGVPPNLLRDLDFLKTSLRQALEDEDFTIVGEGTSVFGNLNSEEQIPGFTIFYVLSESHADIHTYPEHGSIAFNLYSCRSPEDGRQTLEKLMDEWQPEYVHLYPTRHPVVDPNFADEEFVSAQRFERINCHD